MSDPILSTAWSALNASQYALSVHSNNVANADTEGYCRQTVTLTESYVVDSPNGYLGMGVSTEEAERAFSLYIEAMYLDESTDASRWSTEAEWLGYIENVFDQSEENGLNNALAELFQAWEDLSAYPDDESTRSALLGATETLNSILSDMGEDLESQQELIETEIQSQVADVNSIMEDLATLNIQIAREPGNNTLLDARDLLVRDLADLMDVETQYAENGQVTVYLESGQMLVDGEKAYEITYEDAKSWASLTGDSSFEGTAYFEGESSNEIVLEVVTAGTVDGGAGAAQYRVSLDGGQTWQTDDDGNELLYSADGESGAIEVDGVTIWLGDSSDSSALASGELAVGDSFTVMAKSGVYWYKNTSTSENITPLASVSGGDEDDRLTGGSLAGLFSVRDSELGSYIEELDAFAQSLIWETNFASSQGAGLTNYSQVTGTYAAEDSAAAMADSGLAFADNLQSGTFSIALYDETTGDVLEVTAVDFTSVTGSATFDPATDSLDDVAQAINDTYGGQLTATITNGQLNISAASGVEFQFAGDTSGILAASGINTFYTGSTAEDIGINASVLSDTNRINAAVVEATGDIGEGDNTVALAVADLADKDITITTQSGDQSTMTLSEYVNALVAEVGADSSTAQANKSYYSTLADELAQQQESVSGVSLDEELIKIEQYQRLYQVASSLIETSNEMFATLMSMVS
ncbi:flagellar hook-associated protein FlgK [Desulfovibrio ferrophilus]|uniref:Flagellar hook-associated protein 1 n=1 Tax=Desulfovibrio ferrophilus TaxID=241368 RepID=A0A2Z6AWN9_9BACT|nr:flagellar hook-associated protein FlgK [Desulfovibrio ferrophilus]BBD07664.1 flagellar hook-associated protein FlgK [Desulfovibrio ferrophilus]